MNTTKTTVFVQTSNTYYYQLDMAYKLIILSDLCKTCLQQKNWKYECDTGNLIYKFKQYTIPFYCIDTPARPYPTSHRGFKTPQQTAEPIQENSRM